MAFFGMRRDLVQGAMHQPLDDHWTRSAQRVYQAMAILSANGKRLLGVKSRSPRRPGRAVKIPQAADTRPGTPDLKLAAFLKSSV